jgi:phenylpropionate dioxygenase-like ring-hydroxylating dioxygenase large terminal subunit
VGERRFVCRSDEITPGSVRAGTVGDDDVVVWRSADGAVHVHEARCPHLWNHLGAVGQVDGDELVCTAHFWRFDSCGVGTRRLSDGTREPMRDLRRYPSREHDGSVWVELPGD